MLYFISMQVQIILSAETLSRSITAYFPAGSFSLAGVGLGKGIVCNIPFPNLLLFVLSPF